MDEDATPSMTLRALPEEDTVVIERSVEAEIAEWELEEVGRRLANCNSAKIDKVKGLKRYRPSSWLCLYWFHAHGSFLRESSGR